jgi:hypothetical protein
MKQDNEQFCVLPCLALAQSCLQLRREYLPICRTAPVTIDWADVPGYMETFYPTSGSTVQHIHHAPRSITIAIRMDDVSISTYLGGKAEIDLLPLFKIGRANPAFSCSFVHVSPSPTASGAKHQIVSTMERSYLKSDSGVIHAFMQCRNEMWLEDITSGKIFKAMVSLIGTDEEPEARIYVSEDLINAFRGSQVAGETDEDNPMDYAIALEECYLDRTGLNDIFHHIPEPDLGSILCSIYIL